MSTGDNLKSFSGEIESGLLYFLDHHPARERLMINDLSDTNNTDTRVWVGPNPPPSDTDLWFKLDGSMVFRNGVAGPIYFGETTNKQVTLALISTLQETGGSIAMVEICAHDNLVDELDNQLTDENGDSLVFCL